MKKEQFCIPAHRLKEKILQNEFCPWNWLPAIREFYLIFLKSTSPFPHMQLQTVWGMGLPAAILAKLAPLKWAPGPALVKLAGANFTEGGQVPTYPMPS